MSGSALFDEDFLRRLEYLKLVSRQLQAAGLKGEHRVRQRGAGMEFADYRPYVPGDDIRAVDWDAYMRLDKLLVRLFEEEGDLSIYFFVDTSASMEYGDDRKFALARQITGALGYIGLYNLDRITVVAYRNGVDRSLSELRGNNQVFRLFQFLESLEAEGENHLVRAVRDFFVAPRRRGLVIMISDFLEHEWELGLQQLTRLKHDVLAIHVRSVLDEEGEMPYETLLVDAETGRRQRVRVTPELLSDYRTEVALHRDSVAQVCSRNGWSHVVADRDTEIDALILQIFKQGHLVR